MSTTLASAISHAQLTKGHTITFDISIIKHLDIKHPPTSQLITVITVITVSTVITVITVILHVLQQPNGY